MDSSVGGRCISLDDMHLYGLNVSAPHNIGLVVEADDVHYQGVALPVTHGIAHISIIQLFPMTAPICGYVAKDAHGLVKYDHLFGRLDNFEWERPRGHARSSQHETVNFRIGAVVFGQRLNLWQHG